MKLAISKTQLDLTNCVVLYYMEIKFSASQTSLHCHGRGSFQWMFCRDLTKWKHANKASKEVWHPSWLHQHFWWDMVQLVIHLKEVFPYGSKLILLQTYIGWIHGHNMNLSVRIVVKFEVLEWIIQSVWRLLLLSGWVVWSKWLITNLR